MTAVPAPRTWVTGEVVTAAEMNTNISDVLTFALAPPILQARQIVSQSIANSTSPGTAVTYTAEDVDSSGMHSNVTNTSRATAVYPGYYRFSGGIPYVANATGQRGGYATVNGSALNGSNTLLNTTAANAIYVPLRTILAYLSVGDYFEWLATQNSGGALNTGSGGVSFDATLTCVWVSN